MRCQQYGHTRSYCNKPYVCVKCGGSHSTQSCKKSKNTPAQCVFCGGAHPANYRGCEYYHSLLKIPNNTNNWLNIQHNEPTQSQSAQLRPGLSYSEALQGKRNQEPNITYPGEAREDTNNDINTTKLLTKFLEDFKAMFQQLTQQNSMILNMLSTLISKIH
jgi:transcription initiation factor IIF auxiliary subunit